MTDENKQRPKPQLSAKGKKKAEEKFARQADALRQNLRRRHRQRRGQNEPEPSDTEPNAK